MQWSFLDGLAGRSRGLCFLLCDPHCSEVMIRVFVVSKTNKKRNKKERKEERWESQLQYAYWVRFEHVKQSMYSSRG